MASQQATGLECFAGTGRTTGPERRGTSSRVRCGQLAADASAFLAGLQASDYANALAEDWAAQPIPVHLAALGWRIVQQIGPLAAANRFHPSRLERALKAAVLRTFVDTAGSIEPEAAEASRHDAGEVSGREEISGIGMLSSVLADVNAAACELAFLRKEADESTANSEVLAAASEKLFISAFDISQSTEEASAEAAAADESASSGLTAVQKAVGAMQNIADAVEDTAKKLDDVSHASAQIGQILSLTNSIAGQTKLLALNATIEAARAGAAGRGFAVVASEVKRLAEQSAKASEEISRRITALHAEMESILKIMSQTIEAVSEGKRAISSAGGTLDTMSGQVSTVAQKMAGIAQILKEQGGVATDMAQCVDRISTSSKEAGARLAAAAGKLRADTDRLWETEPSAPRGGPSHMALEMARLEHLLLARRITDALLAPDDTPAVCLPDPAQCRLGEWLAGHGPDAAPDRRALTDLHAQVHAQAKTILDARKSGDWEKALGALSAFCETNSQLVQSIGEALAGPPGDGAGLQ